MTGSVGRADRCCGWLRQEGGSSSGEIGLAVADSLMPPCGHFGPECWWELTVTDSNEHVSYKDSEVVRTLGSKLGCVDA